MLKQSTSKADALRAMREAKVSRKGARSSTVEHRPLKPVVVGSSPAAPAINDWRRAVKAALVGYEGTAKRRGRPRIEDRANTIEAQSPWAKSGMSRATWYRRQAEKP